MNDLQVPGVAPYGEYSRRVAGSRNKPDRDRERSRFDREAGQDLGDGARSEREPEPPPARHPDPVAEGQHDEGDGTGKVVNVTA
jgi:hypothetical protein